MYRRAVVLSPIGNFFAGRSVVRMDLSHTAAIFFPLGTAFRLASPFLVVPALATVIAVARIVVTVPVAIILVTLFLESDFKDQAISMEIRCGFAGFRA